VCRVAGLIDRLDTALREAEMGVVESGGEPAVGDLGLITTTVNTELAMNIANARVGIYRMLNERLGIDIDSKLIRAAEEVAERASKIGAAEHRYTANSIALATVLVEMYGGNVSSTGAAEPAGPGVNANTQTS
jgi:hypothetical protein